MDIKQIESELRKLYPHGHEEFIVRCLEEMRLHSDKNFDYAHGGHALGNFERVAHICSQYPGLDLSDPAIIESIYLLKQLDAYLWFKSQGHEAKVEGKSQRMRDVSIYAKIIDLTESEHGNDETVRT